MSTADISKGKLEEVARYLDRFPPLARGQEEEDVEQYWVLLLKELGRLPGSLGKTFSYSRSQLAQFGTAIEKDTSPSIDVLHDLQRKGLPFNEFIKCLERIRCQGALNVFLAATTPEITRQPQAQVLRVGEQLELSCEATCRPGFPQFFWFQYREKEWEPLTDSNTNRLTIPDINVDHSGTYTCRATNPHINNVKKASQFSNHVEVTVEDKDIQQITPIRQEEGNLNHPPSFSPVLTSHPLSIKVEQGERAVLRCQAAGNNLVYDWYKDGAGFRDSNESGELVIEKAKLKDAASYHCNVVNIHGGKIKSHTATITVVPQIVIDMHPPKLLNVEYGEKVTLECRAHSLKGKPLAYQWIKDKKSIPGAQGSTLQISFDNPSSFYIRVHCQVCLAADSSIGVQSSATVITIYHVRITRQPSDTQGCIGDYAELVCEAVKLSSPLDKKIDFLWLKSDSRGGKKELLSGVPKEQVGGKLIFKNLQLLHKGYYYCQLSSPRAGYLTSQEVVVKVDMPEDSQIRITRGPVSWVVSEGGSFRMVCQAEGSPEDPLSYQWYFNSQSIPGATRHILEKREVKVADYGPYYCEVRSSNSHTPSVYSDSVHVTEPHCETKRDKAPPTYTDQWEAERYQWTRDERRYAREKVALLIGNQNYRNLTALDQTESEIQNLAKTLKGINFKVFSFLDLTLVEMHDAFTWFCGLLSHGVYGFFYYCGHGFSQNHICYLMPVNTPEGPPSQQLCLASDFVALKMQATQCRAVMMLDCCQKFNDKDVSLKASTPQTSLDMSNILEIYSCPTGKQAYEKSPFNKCVIEAIAEGVILRDLLTKILAGMRQHITRPWHKGSLMDDQIAFRDEIMRDDLRDEDKLEKIFEQWQLTHTTGLPPKITLEGSQLPKLHEVLVVTIECRALFTNILSLFVSLKPKKEDTIVSLGLGEKSMQNHCVTVKLMPDKTAPYEIRVSGIQRLRDDLSIILCVSATVSGDPVEELVTHILPALHLPSFMSTDK